MTRYTNKRKRWRYTAPRQPRSQRHLKTIEMMQTKGLISAETPDDTVIQCPECERHCFGWQWKKHRECFVKMGVLGEKGVTA